MTDLNTVLNQLTDNQREYVANIAAQLAGIGTDRWSGQVHFEINCSQGTPISLYIHNREALIKPVKARKVRSKGR